ncbi:MAG: GMP synthase [Pedobacter sp.]|nr:MAG: GMP synthase [Pedobacter sp.]
MSEKKHFRVAVLDMNKGHENQGIRSISEILKEFEEVYGVELQVATFEVRLNGELPDLSFDAYISSGGPGSPFDGLGMDWEQQFFQFIDKLVTYNKNNNNKKHLFLICHSFQLACRKFEVAKVIPRYSNAFGVFPVYLSEGGKLISLFMGLENPFYALDSRDWQVIDPDANRLDELGAIILAYEKERAKVAFDRCIMAIQFSPEIVGTQFHPEADPIGLQNYFGHLETKDIIVATHSKEKYENVIDSLAKPDRILITQKTILPNFLKAALNL